jgi:hypothetical protein
MREQVTHHEDGRPGGEAHAEIARDEGDQADAGGQAALRQALEARRQ